MANRERAFKVMIEDNGVRGGFKATWKYCAKGESVEVPRVGDKFELGGREYVVTQRKMPAFADWRKYETPPVVWVYQA